MVILADDKDGDDKKSAFGDATEIISNSIKRNDCPSSLPPLRFIEMDPNERYPPPLLPPPLSVGARKKEAGSSSSSSIMSDAEELVRRAIASRHELASSILLQHSSAAASAGECGDEAADDDAATKSKAAVATKAKAADDVIRKAKQLTDAAAHLTDIHMRRVHNARLLPPPCGIIDIASMRLRQGIGQISNVSKIACPYYTFTHDIGSFHPGWDWQ